MITDKKYASFTDDFRGRIEQERSVNPGERSADFKGEDGDQSKPKSEESDSTSVASSDGGEVMWELGKKRNK